jgi:S1-C subfamily serine protease
MILVHIGNIPMKKNKKSFLFTILLSTVFLMSFSSVKAYEKASEIFNLVKNSIVEISSFDKTTGTLISEDGLILTNNKGIKDSDYLRVKFLSGQELEALVVAQDRKNDLALLWINTSGIKDLYIAKFSDENPLVLIGEELIAFAAPEGREKTPIITKGIVSRYQNGLINHDAGLSGTGFGGPIFNYDAEIVGVNVKKDSLKSSPGGGILISAVDIKNIDALIKEARTTMKSSSVPKVYKKISTLPDYPIDKVDFGDLKKAPRAYKYSFLNTDNLVKSADYKIIFNDPVIGYREMLLRDQEKMKRREKKAEKKGFSTSKDEYDSENIGFYEFDELKEAVIEVKLWPIVVIYRNSFGEKQVLPKRYIKNFDLTDAEGNVLCTPLSRTRQDISTLFPFDLKDKVFAARNKYDPKCFYKEDKLYIDAEYEGENKKYKRKIPYNIRKYLVEDFEAYWSLVGLDKQRPPYPNFIKDEEERKKREVKYGY